MTTSTYAIDCPNGEWTIVALGSEYDTITVYAPGGGLVALAVAEDEPDAASNDYINFPTGGAGQQLTLDTTDEVWVKGTGPVGSSVLVRVLAQAVTP